jgi:hypothetical protein
MPKLILALERKWQYWAGALQQVQRRQWAIHYTDQSSQPFVRKFPTLNQNRYYPGN